MSHGGAGSFLWVDEWARCGVQMPKVRKPKRGWPRLFDPRRFIFRRKRRNTGMPPCPDCGRHSVERDEKIGEAYCTDCGRTL